MEFWLHYIFIEKQTYVFNLLYPQTGSYWPNHPPYSNIMEGPVNTGYYALLYILLLLTIVPSTKRNLSRLTCTSTTHEHESRPTIIENVLRPSLLSEFLAMGGYPDRGDTQTNHAWLHDLHGLIVTTREKRPHGHFLRLKSPKARCTYVEGNIAEIKT